MANTKSRSTSPAGTEVHSGWTLFSLHLLQIPRMTMRFYVSSTTIRPFFLTRNGNPCGDLSTANMTSEKGAHAKFNFVGTSVTWFGIVPSDWPHNPACGSISIDGGAPITFKLNGLRLTGNPPPQYDIPFFTTPDLTPGAQTLLRGARCASAELLLFCQSPLPSRR